MSSFSILQIFFKNFLHLSENRMLHSPSNALASYFRTGSEHRCFSNADAKVGTFSEPANISPSFFSKKRIFLSKRALYLYLLYNRSNFLPAHRRTRRPYPNPMQRTLRKRPPAAALRAPGFSAGRPLPTESANANLSKNLPEPEHPAADFPCGKAPIRHAVRNECPARGTSDRKVRPASARQHFPIPIFYLFLQK